MANVRLETVRKKNVMELLKENLTFNGRAVVSPLLHLFVYYVFLVSFQQLNVPYRWKTQFLILLLFSLSCSLLLLFVKQWKVLSVLLLIRFFLLFILCNPMTDSITIEVLLLSSILYDVYLFFPTKIGIPVAVVLTLLVLFSPGSNDLWGRVQSAGSAENKILAAAILLIVNGTLAVISRYRHESSSFKNILDNYEHTIHSLIEANVNLQENLINEIREAENSERKRLTREIHDIVGHSMVNIMMLSESLRDKIDRNQQDILELVDLTRKQAETVLHDTETSMRRLKSMDYERKFDIVAIKRLADIFQKATGISVVLEFRNAPLSFGKDVDRIVYRILQECMTNSFRHGKATEIKILFWRYPETMEIIIKDNGRGEKNIKEGIGLWGIKERLTGIGGNLEIKSTIAGFELTIRFPWSMR